MIDEYLDALQEGYIFSDKTVSVNLKDFESGKKKKLIIVGLPGSGKTSIGEYLVKKYKIKEFVSDEGWEATRKGLLSPNRTILESAGFIYMVHEPKWKKIVLSYPMILMGMSAIKAGYRADRRDGTVPGKVRDWKDTFHFIRTNFKDFQGRYNKLRKEVLQLPNADIKEFKVPKFETVYH